jgi:hypothetical protein
MAYTKRLILANVSFFKKDSVITNNYDAYVSNDFRYLEFPSSFFKYKNIPNIESLGEHNDVEYFNVNEPFWGIKFISSIDNNVDIRDNNLIEDLIESISSYYSCKITNLIEDVKDFFLKDVLSDRYGIETRRFILLMEESYYYDSYAGDGDYIINYCKIVNTENIGIELEYNEEDPF